MWGDAFVFVYNVSSLDSFKELEHYHKLLSQSFKGTRKTIIF